MPVRFYVHALTGFLLYIQGCTFLPHACDCCTFDYDCDPKHFCNVDTNECVADPKWCETSAECDEPGEFCAPRDEPNFQSFTCRQVEKCEELDPTDVSAWCRTQQGLSGDEAFVCDGSEERVCVRADMSSL